MKKWFKKTCVYPLEAFGLIIFWGISKILGLRASSFVFGKLLRILGPFLPVHKTAQRNLNLVLGDQSSKHPAILKGMWENLGRVVGEYPHLRTFQTLLKKGEIEITNAHILDTYKNSPVFFFSAHIGNWEIPNLISIVYDMKYVSIYRAPNNPYAAWVLSKFRPHADQFLLPKGREGAKDLIAFLKDDYSAGFLMDQKMNDGLAVPFFGLPAMTASALAHLILKHQRPVIPVRVIRTQGCQFKGVVYDPLTFDLTGDKATDVYTILWTINKHIEQWIRETPEQWLWVHNRFPGHVEPS